MGLPLLHHCHRQVSGTTGSGMSLHSISPHLDISARRISFEWALIAGENDGEEQARELVLTLTLTLINPYPNPNPNPSP